MELPEVAKLLVSRITNEILGAIVDANTNYKDFVAESIIKCNPKRVGIYRLIMKLGYDNFSTSSIQGALMRIKA